MLNFIAALYNEEQELGGLLEHVYDYVDGIYLVDDESTDETPNLLAQYEDESPKISWKTIPHTGLPETVKNEALSMVPDGSWVLMLDADERFADGVLEKVREFFDTFQEVGNATIHHIPKTDVTHIYFQQLEVIEGQHVRTFQKSKLFKKEAIRFSAGIHEDDQFEGPGLYKPEWVVYHRKSWDKQKTREAEYLATYDRLFAEGKIDEGRRQWLRGLHYFK